LLQPKLKELVGAELVLAPFACPPRGHPYHIKQTDSRAHMFMVVIGPTRREGGAICPESSPWTT
ncbi:MAG: hypothetical protein L7R66_00875, partial [Candidatus Thalassarchaeaceae archaeon]|nr:hypothetical protein [Candidatus Thalassarchaeaceae archaeon]